MLITNNATSASAGYQAVGTSSNKSSAPYIPTRNQSDTSSTKVTISDAARQAAQAESSPTTSESQESNSGIEQYAIPNWYGHYGIEINPKLGAKGDDIYLSPGAGKLGPEYADRLNSIMSSVLKSNGITSNNYHERMIVDKESSEDIHQQFVARLKQDPQMVRWLKDAGISLV